MTFLRLLARELLLSIRHGGDTLAAVLFFVLAGALFPLAIGPAPEVLARLAPGVVWVCALLAALLPLDRLFGADGEDGSLDQLLLCGLPASAVALAKAMAHWLVTGVPLLIAAAPLALMLRMEPDVLPALLAGLVPGGPGHSHQSVRDIAALAAVPGLVLLEPATETETAEALEFCLATENAESCVLRLVSIPVEVQL